MSNEARIVNLFKSTQTEREEFREKVAANHGKLSVWVHPFYSDYLGRDSGLDHAFTQPRYTPFRDKLLARMLARNLPVLFLEEQRRLEKLTGSIKRLGGGLAYAIETEDDTHMPAQGLLAWNLLVHTMKMNGVKTVYISGMYMINYQTEVARYYAFKAWTSSVVNQRQKLIQENPHASRWLRNNIMPTGCAGSAATHFLDSGFDVRITNANTPCRGFEYIPVQLQKLAEGEEA